MSKIEIESPRSPSPQPGPSWWNPVVDGPHHGIDEILQAPSPTRPADPMICGDFDFCPSDEDIKSDIHGECATIVDGGYIMHVPEDEPLDLSMGNRGGLCEEFFPIDSEINFDSEEIVIDDVKDVDKWLHNNINVEVDNINVEVDNVAEEFGEVENLVELNNDQEEFVDVVNFDHEEDAAIAADNGQNESGYDSEFSEAETVENVRDEIDRDPDYCPNNETDSDMDYDPISDSEREDRLHRVYGLRKHFWRARREILSLERQRDLMRIKHQIKKLRDRRRNYRKNVNSRLHKKLLFVFGNNEERPTRGEICVMCSKAFWCQKLRRWSKCEVCLGWLCPRCSEEPEHCERQE